MEITNQLANELNDNPITGWHDLGIWPVMEWVRPFRSKATASQRWHFRPVPSADVPFHFKMKWSTRRWNSASLTDGNIVDYRSWDGWISRDPISSESALLRQSLRPSTDVIITVNVIIIRIWHMGYSGFVSHAPNTSHLMVMKWTSTITWLIPFFKHFSHQRFQIWRWHFPVFQFSSFPVFQFSSFPVFWKAIE